MAALMREGRSEPALHDLLFPLVERLADNDGFNPISPEFRESKHALGQLLVLGRYPEALFDKSVDSDRLRRGGIQIDSFQLVSANLLDLAQLEMRALQKWAVFASNMSHDFFL